MSRLVSVAIIVGSLILALLVVSLGLVLLGQQPDTILLTMFSGAFGSFYGLSETLLRTVPVLLCALAAAIPAESGQINIGGEGQLHLGAIGAVLVTGPLMGRSAPLVIILMITAAIFAGAVWAAIPATLRALLGVNEALVSLFLNYVAIYLLQYLVQGPLRDPASQGWPMGSPLDKDLVLSRLGDTRLHLGIFVAILLALFSAAVIRLTRRGTELRVVGLNAAASATVGIPVRGYLFASLALGGAVAGLAGYYEIAAVQHRLRPDLSLGFGYSGFLVAWICRRQLLLIIPVSILVAGLIVGAENLQITSGLPAATGDVAQGFLLLFVLLSQPLLAWLKRRRAIRLVMESELS
ncbi:MAG TPA: ABC transporter permease [Pyrinomonadaceae bacterium]|nr:ABC transporter permease [Pyrinomonadaceae bacterium]